MSSSPRYTIAHTECSLGWGGQEIRIVSEMTAMRDRGHRLLLMAPERAQIFRKASEAGLPVIAISDHRPRLPATVLNIAGILRREQVEIVNTHSSFDGWLGGLAARLARQPTLFRSRHIEVDYPNRARSRIAYHHLPHHVITTSRRIADRMIVRLDLDPDRINCVPTGIDVQRFHPNLQGSLRDELGIAETTPLVGMISVLRSWKGHPTFLEAASTLLNYLPDTRFIIAGDGPQRSNIEERIRSLDLTKSVHLLGHREDVPNLLASLDVLVLPSTAHEGIPQILLQAQAMKTPIIATRVGGIPEIIEHDHSGWLVEPDAAGEIAIALARLLRDPETQTRYADAAFTRVRQHHSLDAMCRSLEALYERYREEDPTSEDQG